MANPPTYPSDGRLTTLQNYSSGLVGTELMEIVSPGNASLGMNYNITTQKLANALTPLSTTIVTVPQGGTNTSVLGTGVLLGNGTAAVSVVVAATAGLLLTSQGSTLPPAFLPATPTEFSPQSPNLVLAGPSSGVATAVPTFRALVPMDLPANLSTINNSTILGNNSGTTGPPSALTASQVAGITEQGMTLLNVVTASAAATVGDTSSFSSAYNDYIVTIGNMLPSISSSNFQCLVQSNGTFATTNYLNAVGGATTYVDLMAGTTTLSTTAGLGWSGEIHIYNINSTTSYKAITKEGIWYTTGGAMTAANSGGLWNGSTSVLTGIQFQMNTGTLTGVIKVYALRSAL